MSGSPGDGSGRPVSSATTGGDGAPATQVESLMRLNADGVQATTAFRTVGRSRCAPDGPEPVDWVADTGDTGSAVAMAEVALDGDATSASRGRRVYQVQLASYISIKHACRGWTLLRHLAPELLEDVEHVVHEVHGGSDDTVYFRLRTRPVSDQDVAEDLCAELHSRRISCLLVESAVPSAS